MFPWPWSQASALLRVGKLAGWRRGERKGIPQELPRPDVAASTLRIVCDSRAGGPRQLDWGYPRHLVARR